MKVFFEEYGLVIVVTILAFGMITFSNGFKEELSTQLETSWNALVAEAAPTVE